MGLEEGITLPVPQTLEKKSRKRKRSLSPTHNTSTTQRKSQSLPKLGDEGNNVKSSNNGRKPDPLLSGGPCSSTKLPVIPSNNTSTKNNSTTPKLPSLGGAVPTTLNGGGVVGGAEKQVHSSPELLILPQVAVSETAKNSKNSRKIGWE